MPSSHKNFSEKERAFKVVVYQKSPEETLVFTPLSEKIFCKNCKENQAILRISHPPIPLCRSCFLAYFEKKVKRNIEKFKMIKEKDRVGVFLSGGKDSSVLFGVLKSLYPEREIIPIFIHLGIGYFSDRALEVVERVCERFEARPYVYYLKKEKGFSIDDFIFTHFKNKVCAVCGTVKRYLFSKIAKELNLTVFATGHHLDDLVSTMFTLFIHGDFEGIKRLSPVSPPLTSQQAKKIKPLYNIPEIEVFYYGVLKDIPIEALSCPHSEKAVVKKYKKFIDLMEKQNREIKYQLLSVFLKKLSPLVKSRRENLFFCENCGEPTSAPDKICSFCRRTAILERTEREKIEINREEISEIIEKFNEKNKILIILKDFQKKQVDLIKDNPFKDFETFEVSSEEIMDNSKGFRKFLKKFKLKDRLVFILSQNPEKAYSLVLKLRKTGVRAYFVKNFP